MVIRSLTFIPDDPDFLNVRPGSPHPFFSLISSASSSPDVWSNCISGFAAGIASAHRRCRSTPDLQALEPVRAEAGAADEGRAQLLDRTSAGYPTYLAPTQVSEVRSLFGRVGGMAVDLLDAVTLGLTKKGNEMDILAFEVANTIVRGANLMESLSEESIRHLMEVVLPSDGVQCLVSEDMNELLNIAAMDKKEELKAFLGEVARFGNHCKNPVWHNWDRYFEIYFKKLPSQLPEVQSKVGPETLIQQLMILVQHTAELYYELQVLDRLKQDYIRAVHDFDSSSPNQRGTRDILSILRANLKVQLRRVRSLKKKSLWSRTEEEVVEQLVDLCFYLHSKLHEAFGIVGNSHLTNHRTLGSAGWDLHYANIITQISALVSQPRAVTPNVRDALYQGLPRHVKSALHRDLLKFNVPEELNLSEIIEIMEEKLQWLVPMATKTIKAHHSFGWLVEWANFVTNPTREPEDVIRIETLHHADIEKTDLHILELLSWLHLLVGRSRAQDAGVRSPTQDVVQLSLPRPDSSSEIEKTLGTSGNLKFGNAKTLVIKSHHRHATSSSNSAVTETESTFSRERPLYPNINFNMDWTKVLDVIDGVDTM
ncbi:uncharacterized protein LOC116206298 isoform X2 [Punica granatum]|uniref:Uncharacterized protein LOC116206298 isoform X2 n=1 Tax=Punica granatum TaxID=22663 RepID=A0A6P8DCN7_PUNGR|nr:uncharacterized protein LOC116206298 isoform X2 [Punica granatum]